MKIEQLLPEQIEKRSFEMISEELNRDLDPLLKPIIYRVIHTTADFDYADTMYFSEGVVEHALEALKKGATIVTDTNMALSGINKKALEALGCRALCYIADPEVAKEAKKHATTRAHAAVDKAAKISGPLIFVVGNAPTALLRLRELIDEKEFKPELIIGVPVGFVNVEVAKERIIETDVPVIVSRGRKGGSNVAAAIVNALMYQLTRDS
ncbi:MAG TPA: precorrin-8X methylmutase [Tissierellia bacterium]|jgi:precorrin-8X/cobalt-precorrin-8 methylmutase|nr:precorrin-8X methylmutase [Tissierellia bacterium]